MEVLYASPLEFVIMSIKDVVLVQRKTYALIDRVALKENIKEIKRKYSAYEYYFGVVKNNCYHHGMKCVVDMYAAGINYFAVSSLEEAFEVRKYLSDAPVLCLEPIDLEFLDDVINKEITITIESLEYLQELLKLNPYSHLKIHLKVDSGMHRLGFCKKEDLSRAVELIREHKNLILEGIYSHFATSGITDSYWDFQVKRFLEITEDINLKEIPIVHFGRSLTLVNHPKLSFCNGIRLGIVLYGFAQSRKEGTSFRDRLRVWKRKRLQKKNHCSKTTLENDLALKPVFSLYSTVMSVREVEKEDLVGYDGVKAPLDGYILTIPIGYADGVTKSFDTVFIEGKFCKIFSDCMDMILVFSEEKVALGTEVELIGPHKTIQSVCQTTGKNAYHLLNDISNRVVRVHVHEEEKEEIYY